MSAARSHAEGRSAQFASRLPPLDLCENQVFPGALQERIPKAGWRGARSDSTCRLDYETSSMELPYGH